MSENERGTIYLADINSAYPYAMSLLPDMATGCWNIAISRGVDTIVLTDGDEWVALNGAVQNALIAAKSYINSVYGKHAE